MSRCRNAVCLNSNQAQMRRHKRNLLNTEYLHSRCSSKNLLRVPSTNIQNSRAGPKTHFQGNHVIFHLLQWVVQHHCSLSLRPCPWTTGMGINKRASRGEGVSHGRFLNQTMKLARKSRSLISRLSKPSAISGYSGRTSNDRASEAHAAPLARDRHLCLPSPSCHPCRSGLAPSSQSSARRPECLICRHTLVIWKRDYESVPLQIRTCSDLVRATLISARRLRKS
jgi:hypothetical protein